MKDYIFSCLFLLVMRLLENFQLHVWLISGPHHYRVLKVILSLNFWYTFYLVTVSVNYGGFLFMYICVVSSKMNDHLVEHRTMEVVGITLWFSRI